jgi:hypothetical protein
MVRPVEGLLNDDKHVLGMASLTVETTVGSQLSATVSEGDF